MRTRGKRVTAEATIPRDDPAPEHAGRARAAALPCPDRQRRRLPLGRQQQRLRTRPTASRPCSSPPARTSPTSPSRRPASSTPRSPRTERLYISITIPSLIVATHGGGTALPTQRECLEILGCAGRGRCGSSPRSSPASCSPESSRSPRRSRRSTGSPRTSSTGGTVESRRIGRDRPLAGSERAPPARMSRASGSATSRCCVETPRRRASSAAIFRHPDRHVARPHRRRHHRLGRASSPAAAVPRAGTALARFARLLLRSGRFSTRSSSRCPSRCSSAAAWRSSVRPTSSSARSSPCARTSCRRRSPTSSRTCSTGCRWSPSTGYIGSSRRISGGRSSAMFSWIDPNPLGSASIAQIHRATPLDGDEVILKVVKPGIRETAEARRPPARISRALPADFPQRYQPRSSFASSPSTPCARWTCGARPTTPRPSPPTSATCRTSSSRKIYPQFTRPPTCSPWSFSTATSRPRPRPRELDQEQRAHLVDLGAEAIIRMLYRDGFFHADLHPGNLIILPGPKVGFIDLGMVGRFDEELQRTLLYYYYSLVMGDVGERRALPVDGRPAGPQGRRRRLPQGGRGDLPPLGQDLELRGVLARPAHPALGDAGRPLPTCTSRSRWC